MIGARAAVSMVAALAVAMLVGAWQPPAPDPTSGGTVTSTTPAATNPVWPNNFPDPQILPDGDGWVAISTNGNGMNVQTLVSDDLVTWTQGSDAMPTLASWTTPGKVWAPEAHRFGDRWLMYYTTKAPDPTIQCIGLAVADDPKGPYRDTSSEPLVCEEDQGGSIDASPFVAADGTAHLYWKNDGNAVGVDTWISVQRLSADGLRLEGEPKRLLRQDLPWEGQLVEAPFVWERDGVFHLFYSANDYGSDAVCRGARDRIVADRAVHQGPRPDPDDHRGRRRPGALRAVRAGRPGAHGLSRLGARLDRLGDPRPHDVAERGDLRRKGGDRSLRRAGSCRRVCEHRRLAPAPDVSGRPRGALIARGTVRGWGPPRTTSPTVSSGVQRASRSDQGADLDARSSAAHVGAHGMTIRDHVVAEASTSPSPSRISRRWISSGRKAVAPVSRE